MSESADLMYEELHARIAELLNTVAEKDRKINELKDKAQGFGAELIDSQLKYHQLMKDTFTAINESNKTISKLVDKMDGGSRW